MSELEIVDNFEKWKKCATYDPDLIKELQSVEGKLEEIKDRFYRDLEFGTAGMRGVIGAGTNRMNVYVVGRITKALSCFLQSFKKQSVVVISYDNRIKSKLFAKIAAEVLAFNNIKVKIFKTLKPVPILSYAVRFLKCDSGIMITASHNPAEYNGYKVFGSDGCQITQSTVDDISNFFDKINFFSDVERLDFEDGLNKGLISYCDDEIEQNFLHCVKNSLIQPEILECSDLNLVYTPLNGSGLEPVTRMITPFKISSFHVVESQKEPDGNFPTCKSPNPEMMETFEQALVDCKKLKPDIAIATDPDCDRIGVLVRNVKTGNYKLLNGNQLGVLMLNYLCSQRVKLNIMPLKPMVVKTIVSTPMADCIANKYGLNVVNVLTGFKYIGEQIAKLEQNGEQDNFIFGFEESQGYLAGSYVRDKDGVFATMLICEMAVFYKSIGKTLIDVLNDLYCEFGFFKSTVQSYVFKGSKGMKKMLDLMDKFRNSKISQIGNFKVIEKLDYLVSKKFNLLTGEESLIKLPKSNVIEFGLDGGFRVVIRVSGTEPKVKAYYHVKGSNKENAADLLNELKLDFKKLINF